jgi:hypothetical protein
MKRTMAPTAVFSKSRRWAEEFSVHGAEDKYVLRRQFTKFLVLTSFGMFAGNVWIWVRSLLGERTGRVSRAAVGECVRDPGGRRQAVQVSNAGPLHHGAQADGATGGLQPEVHAPGLRGLLLAPSTTGSSAHATKGTSRSTRGACCRVRRRGRCRASASKNATGPRGRSRSSRDEDALDAAAEEVPRRRTLAT